MPKIQINLCDAQFVYKSKAVLVGLKEFLIFSFCFFAHSGWISALTGLNESIPVGIIMILIAALFTSLAVMSLIMFKKVRSQ